MEPTRDQLIETVIQLTEHMVHEGITHWIKDDEGVIDWCYDNYEGDASQWYS